MPRTWNKTDLAEAVAEGADITKKDARAAVDVLLETVTRALINGDKVQLTGFGSFETRKHKERRAKNLHTGEEIIVPPRRAAAFKAGKGLKDAMK